MAYNAFSQSVFSMDAPCLPCCETACFLTLPPPDGDPAYADEATAQAVLDDATQVSNCIGFFDTTGFPVGITSFTATDGGSSLTMAAVLDSANSGIGPFWGACSALGGQTLSFAWSGFVEAGVTIYDEAGTPVESLGPSSSSPLVSSALPADGNYSFFIALTNSPPNPPASTGSATITSSGGVSFCPIRAAYDDGGSTAYLICV